MKTVENELQGRTCLVTGGSSGIGKAAALAFAKRGAKVIIVNRDPQRGSQALAELRVRTGNPDIHLQLADLSSQAEIHRLAAAIKEQTSRLDVLANVAGAMFQRRRVNADGLEMNLALNYLSHFLLSNLLLDLLVKSAPARIINVTSVAHWWGRINFNDLQNKHRYNIFTAYGNAKLAIILFTRELARRLAGTGVIANCVHPGIVATGIIERVMDSPIASSFADFFFLTPAQGAETILYLSAHPQADRWNGEYFVRKRPGWCSKRSRDMQLAARLWSVSEQYTGQVEKG